MKSTPRTPRPATAWQRLSLGMTKLLTATMAVVLAVTFTGCEGQQPYAPIPAEAYAPRPTGNLAAGDVLNISFPGAPEMNTTQKIQANGKVSLPTVGSVTAQGKSVSGLQSQLTGMYQSHLQNPAVLVAVETAASGVYVTGEVMKPGKVSLDRPMTVLEAIGECGGFTKFANPKQVVVVRNQGGKHQSYTLNLSNTFSGADHSAFYLRPYDTVLVKQSRW
ncbi:polysaccharide export protein [Luteolibacter flavescens]|uniref:Polysaccharide export protein n=1 Tax=Luteolibacter flavescens TaxID=1859460 RepID=A0ABT3FS24_9BACT|nr:polysaccharide biosynthesis/export family protein [Luteolibacter flavescens]MCW1886352.1 polysaccharide export protein [Luteolibacter flavescens]